MARYYQIAVFLLAIGQIYCLEEGEFQLKDGRTLRLLSTEEQMKDVVLNGTHINKLFNYYVRGIAKSDYEKGISWSLDLLVSTELQLADGRHHIGSCNVHLYPPYGKVSEDIFEVLEKHIRENLCNSSKAIDQSALDNYEDKNRELNNLLLSELKYQQARDGLDTVFDMGLLVARNKLGIQDFIDIASMKLSYLDISYVTFGNLSTIARAEPVKISQKNDVLSLTVLMKMKPTITFTTKLDLSVASMFAVKIKVYADELLAGCTIKLDYTQKQCRTAIDDVKLDFGSGIKIQLISSILDFLMIPVTAIVEAALKPNLLISQLRTVLENHQEIYLDCDLFKPLFKQL